MTPLHVSIYRHAESASNAGEKTDYPDTIPLTVHGRLQAERLAAAISEPPRRLICSPFLRSSETLAPIAARLPEAERLVWPIEEFTYLTPSACVGTSWRERKPMIDAYWGRLDPDFVDGHGAESFRHLLARARDFLDRLAALPDGPTLAISHGQFMQATMMMAEDRQMDVATAMAVFVERQLEAPFANCERLSLHIEAGRIRASRR